jgi:O-6-methylguanine DNA methyltransferase
MFLKNLYYTTLNTPVQSLFIISSEKGLVKIQFFNKNSHIPFQNLKEGYTDVTLIDSKLKNQTVLRQLKEYFNGTRKKFTVPLDIQGTPFQKQVWEAVSQVPYGETCSYGEIARRIGKPKAVRAVGMANHNNPVPIVIPCHRIIGADGSLTGYGAGISIKEKLLHLEQKNF